MNTLNIVTERKAQILAEKLSNRIQEILTQISNIQNDLLFTESFGEANKYNKQLKKLLNIAVYYMVLADKFADKYQGELVNFYNLPNNSFKNWVDMYSVLKSEIRDLSNTINKLH